MRTNKSICVFVSLVIATLLISSGSPGHAQSATLQKPDYQGLVAKVQQDGFIRVIVGFDIDTHFQTEGYTNPNAVQAQRLAIQKSQAEISNSLSRYKATTYARYQTIPYMALKVDQAALQALIALPQVTSIQEDILVPPELDSSIPVIGVDHVWAAGIEGTGWTVAVIDTGVQWDHPFLGGSANSRVLYEACYSNSGGSGAGVSLCPNGLPSQITGHAADPTIAGCDNAGTNICEHGTHVAGIAAGEGATFSGVARKSNLIAVQVFTRFNDPGICPSSDPCVSSYTSDQIRGVELVYLLHTAYPIASVNMSLGTGKYNDHATCDSANPAMKAAIDNLRSVEIATIVSSGNDGYTNGVTSPACISSAIAVGATADNDLVPSFSNSSDLVDLLAPGVSITSSVPYNMYAALNGTSMAAPHAAGTWALLKSLRPTVTVTEVLTALQTTGITVIDSRNGIVKPRIQVDMAVAALDVTTWLGNSAAWGDVNNWSASRIPTYMSNVTIPISPTGGNLPTVNANAAVHNLTIQDGAQISMVTNTLDVYGSWEVQGSGRFDATGGTVTLRATPYDVHRNQTITMTHNANDRFFNLQIGDGSVARTITLGSDLDVNGELTIMPGASLNGGDKTIHVAGNWTDYATTFIPGTSTVVLDGSTQTVQKQRSVYLLGPEGFESTVPSGWSKYQLADPTDPGWLQGYKGAAGSDGDPAPHGGAQYAWHNDDDLEADAWLVTPPITIPAGSSAALSFWEYNYRPFPTYKYHGIQVSTGSCDPNNGQFSQLAEYAAWVYTWTQRTLDLSPYTAQTVCLAFKYQGNFDDEWYIDDVAVNASGSWDGDLDFSNLTVNSAGNGAAFSGNVSVGGNLLVGGVMDLDTHDLTVEGALTNTGTLRQKKNVPGGVTTEFLHVQNTAGNVDKYFGVDITPGSAMSQTTVMIAGNLSCTSNVVDTLVHRCYALTPGTNYTATIRFWYTESERNNRAANALKLWHPVGPPWQWVKVGENYQYSETGIACASANCWFQADNIATYLPFSLGDRFVVWLPLMFKN